MNKTATDTGHLRVFSSTLHRFLLSERRDSSKTLIPMARWVPVDDETSQEIELIVANYIEV